VTRISLNQLPKPWVEERRWEAVAEVAGGTPIKALGPDPLTAVWLLCEVLAQSLDEELDDVS
jgi:hypothetical protein